MSGRNSASLASLPDLANPAGHHRRQRHRGREPDRRRGLVRRVGQRERAHLPSCLARRDPDLQKEEETVRDSRPAGRQVIPIHGAWPFSSPCRAGPARQRRR
jgi:hypothetical protein